MSELSTLALARSDDAREIAEMSRDFVEHGLTWSWTPARVQHFIAGADSSVVVVRNNRRADPRYGELPAVRGAASKHSPSCTSAMRPHI